MLSRGLKCLWRLILDVGCGSRPYRKRGYETVCIDTYAGYTPQAEDQRRLVKVEHGDYFVRASEEHIPFKDNVFLLVVARHTIEHVDQLFQMLKELIRVSNQKILIKCPHRFSIGAKKPFHKHYFNITWFRNTLKNFDVKYKILLSYRRVFVPKLPIKIILF